MNKQSYRRLTCRLCGHRNLIKVLHLEPNPLPDAYVSQNQIHKIQPVFPLDLVLCKNCGQVQLSVVVYPEIIYKDYLYVTTSSLGLVKHFQQYAADTLSLVKPSLDSLVVDIGSNDGSLLRAYKDRGLRVLGVDPAVGIAREASQKGIKTLPEFFTPKLADKILRSDGPATMVTANNLYANIDELDELTDGVKHLLAPDGVFIFESFYLLDLVRHMVFDFIYHEHLSYFTVKPVQTYFKRHGMELIDVKRVPTKGGSLRYTIQRSGGKRRTSRSVKKMLELESDFGIHRQTTFKLFGKKINQAKNKLRLLALKLKAEGKTIAGYGASATSTTLIYHFQLQHILDFLIDDFDRKQNTFSPGYHIPVYSPAAIKIRKPDYIVILAWRYAEPIIKNNQAYLQNGGSFIIPLPKLKVVSGVKRPA
jgi:hypothetical protein